MNSILDEENRKATRIQIQNYLDELRQRDLLVKLKEKQRMAYADVPEGVNPLFDHLDSTDQSTYDLCDSTIKFIAHNNTKFLGLQDNITALAA